ncbi:MAG: PAS domain S-box protein [Acetobacteraceae bacterium]|nr:PAS domain S-box protein [Acetobacteraceae bacterium]
MSAATTSAGTAGIDTQELSWLVYHAMDQSDDIVLLLEAVEGAADGEAVLIGMNGAFRRASGFADAQAIGQPVSRLLPLAKDAATLRDAIAHQTNIRTEMACTRADGGQFVLGLHMMPVPSPGHRRFAILARDITAVREARQMQASVQRLLAKVFLCIDEAVVIVDSGGQVVMTNPHADHLLGHLPNGMIGKNLLTLVSASMRDIVAARRERQLAEGTDITHDTVLLRADGSEMPARLTSSVIEREDRKRVCVITIRPQAEAAEDRVESAGRIKLVGLEEVRTLLGDRWPAAAARAMATAETVIRRRCGPRDSFSRIDDTSFLMCFADLDEKEASLRAALIAREVRARLIGQGGDSGAAEVRSVAAAVRYPYRKDQPLATLHVALLGELSAQLDRIETEARRVLRTAVAHAECDREAIYGRNPEVRIGTLVRLPDALEHSLTCALSALSPAETNSFDLNGLLLGLAAREAIAALSQGDSAPVLVGVDFDIFTSRAFTERFIALCHQLDQRLRGRLVLLLSHLPEGLPKTRLFECVNRLRPFCHSVGFQVDAVSALEPIDFSISGTPIVALPATALAGFSDDKLKRLISTLHARRARLLVQRIASDSAAALLLSYGVDMISLERSAP